MTCNGVGKWCDVQSFIQTFGEPEQKVAYLKLIF